MSARYIADCIIFWKTGPHRTCSGSSEQDVLSETTLEVQEVRKLMTHLTVIIDTIVLTLSDIVRHATNEHEYSEYLLLDDL